MSIRTIGSSALVVAWLLAVAACDGGPASRSGSTRGVVVAVNRDAGEITLDHEAVPGLMEAMKMPFPVADPKILEGVQPGQQVEFDVEYRGGMYTVQAIRPAPPSSPPATD
jgi:protein SCO1/2